MFKLTHPTCQCGLHGSLLFPLTAQMVKLSTFSHFTRLFLYYLMFLLLICLVCLDHQVSHIAHLMEHNVYIVIHKKLCGCSLKVHYLCNNVILYTVFVCFNVDVMNVCVFFECDLINLSYLIVYISVIECTGGFNDLVCVALYGSVARPVLNYIIFLSPLNVSEH